VTGWPHRPVACAAYSARLCGTDPLEAGDLHHPPHETGTRRAPLPPRPSPVSHARQRHRTGPATERRRPGRRPAAPQPRRWTRPCRHHQVSHVSSSYHRGCIDTLVSCGTTVIVAPTDRCPRCLVVGLLAAALALIRGPQAGRQGLPPASRAAFDGRKGAWSALSMRLIATCGPRLSSGLLPRCRRCATDASRRLRRSPRRSPRGAR